VGELAEARHAGLRALINCNNSIFGISKVLFVRARLVATGIMDIFVLEGNPLKEPKPEWNLPLHRRK
jgi:hypothetical protein